MFIHKEVRRTHLNSGASLLFEQYIFWLHVAMYNPTFVQRMQALQQAVGELAHQLQGEPLKLVFLYQLVQVDRQQFKSYTSVIPKCERVKHVNHVHRVILILLSQVLQYTDLLLSLPVETLLVPHHLQSDVFALLVVVRFDNLTETTLSYHFQDLISIRNVVVRDVDVGALFVVVLAVVREADQTGPLLGVRAYEIHLWIVEYFAVLVRGEFVHIELHDLLGASGGGRRALVGRLRVVGRRRGRAGLQRRQRAVPQQRAPERVRAPQRHVAGHGRAPAATDAHLARRGRAADPRAIALEHTTAPHCTCTR